jgi:hypothetical protein
MQQSQQSVSGSAYFFQTPPKDALPASAVTHRDAMNQILTAGTDQSIRKLNLPIDRERPEGLKHGPKSSGSDPGNRKRNDNWPGQSEGGCINVSVIRGLIGHPVRQSPCAERSPSPSASSVTARVLRLTPSRSARSASRRCKDFGARSCHLPL